MQLNYENWLEYLDAAKSSDIINKSKQEELFKTFAANQSAKIIEQRATIYDETIFLAKLALGGKLNIFHHFRTGGGTIYDETTACGFIIGIKKTSLTIATPDRDILFKKPEGRREDDPKVPIPSEILAVTTTEEIDNLTASDTASYRARPFIPLPPFLARPVNQIISRSQGDIKLILLEVIRAIKEFDTTHDQDAEFTEKAAVKCVPLLNWLYLAMKNDGPIPKIDFEVCENDTITDILKKITKDNLGSRKETMSISEPLEKIAASNLMTQNAVTSMLKTQESSSSSDKSSRSFAKIAPSYKKMILIAGTSGEAIPERISNEGMQFFSQSNEKNALVFLNAHLEERNIRVSVPAAVATLLLHGSFLWTNHCTPSGLAMSLLVFETIDRYDILQEALVIDLNTRFEMTPSTVDKLTKTHICLPTSTEEFLEKLKALNVITILFWSEVERLPQALTSLSNWCTDNRSLLEARASSDKQFLAKMSVSIDERIYLWLKSCHKARDGTDTNDTLIDFSSLQSQLEVNSFNFNLPTTIKTVKRKEDNTSQDKDGKRQKIDDSAPAQRMINQSMNQNWKLRPNERYETVFAHKIKEGPRLSHGGPGCHKFHNKGVCYDDCPHKGSHRILDGNDKKVFDEFCKKCRGEL